MLELGFRCFSGELSELSIALRFLRSWTILADNLTPLFFSSDLFTEWAYLGGVEWSVFEVWKWYPSEVTRQDVIPRHVEVAISCMLFRRIQKSFSCFRLELDLSCSVHICTDPSSRWWKQADAINIIDPVDGIRDPYIILPYFISWGCRSRLRRSVSDVQMKRY